MEKYQWVAYGLDMLGYVILETEGIDKSASHDVVVKQLLENKIEFDTVEPFDQAFVRRVDWLKTTD